MKKVGILLILTTFLFCSPKGPQTFNSPFIGKLKSELIEAKGAATEIKVFDDSKAYIYRKKEEYYGKKDLSKAKKTVTPKKVLEIEHIYYINNKGYVYKYQVWKKRLK